MRVRESRSLIYVEAVQWQPTRLPLPLRPQRPTGTLATSMRFRLLIGCLAVAGSLSAAQDDEAPRRDDATPGAEPAPSSKTEAPNRAENGDRTDDTAPDDAEKNAPKKELPAAPGDLSDAEKAMLVGILAKAGAEDARLRVVERTATRQTRVMYALAKEDLERALAMYCPAGDAVLERFDPKQDEATNLRRMEAELLEQLPRARELGCLNHIKNDDVVVVDVAADAVAESRYPDLVAAAQAAVSAGKLERFLFPPSHPGAFHFEIPRHEREPKEQKNTKPKNAEQKPSHQ